MLREFGMILVSIVLAITVFLIVFLMPIILLGALFVFLTGMILYMLKNPNDLVNRKDEPED